MKKQFRVTPPHPIEARKRIATVPTRDAKPDEPDAIERALKTAEGTALLRQALGLDEDRDRHAALRSIILGERETKQDDQ
jgi:hypothetical protein